MRHLYAVLLLALAACGPRPAPRSVVDSTPPATIDSFAPSITYPNDSGPRTMDVLVPRALQASFGGFPKLRLVGYWATAADSMVKLKTKVYVSNFKATDSLVYSYFQGPGGATAAVLAATTPIAVSTTRLLLDSTFATAPAYGDSLSYMGCAELKYGAGGSSGKSCWTPWKYKRPALPPATIDSLKRLTLRGRPLVTGGPFVTQIGMTAKDSNQAQYCALGDMASGLKVKIDPQPTEVNLWNICEALYQQWLTEGGA